MFTVNCFVLTRFVLNELIQTEKDYVKDLGIVVEVRQQHIHTFVIQNIVIQNILPPPISMTLTIKSMVSLQVAFFMVT